MRRWFVLLVFAAAVLPVAARAAPPAPPTAEERAAAIVQPSISYIEITFASRLYDNHNHHFVRDDPFSVTYSCTGFFVNPDGWVATAGHCVAFDDEVKKALVDQGGEWAYQLQEKNPANRYYQKADFTEQEILDT